MIVEAAAAAKQKEKKLKKENTNKRDAPVYIADLLVLYPGNYSSLAIAIWHLPYSRIECNTERHVLNI